jgi:signal transduction histidine kinase
MRIPDDSANAPGPSASPALLDVQAKLCGQIGHDVSNLLGVISNFAQLLQREITDERARGDLDMLRSATDQAVALNRSLLTFSGRVTSNPITEDLSTLVRECLPALDGLTAGRASLSLDLTEHSLPVNVDPDQLATMLRHLVANALDASDGEATVRISTQLGTVDSLPCATFVVSDSGEGMSPDVLASAVEPFFTTRPRRIGSGLGLSVVHGLAQVNGGALTLESEQGTGTTARVTLPLNR